MASDDIQPTTEASAHHKIRQLTTGGSVKTTMIDNPLIVRQVNRTEDPPTAIVRGPKGGDGKIVPNNDGSVRFYYQDATSAKTEIRDQSPTPPDWVNDPESLLSEPTPEITSRHEVTAGRKSEVVFGEMGAHPDISHQTVVTARELWDQIYDDPDHTIARIEIEAAACMVVAFRTHNDPITLAEFTDRFEEKFGPKNHSVANAAKKVAASVGMQFIPPSPVEFVDSMGEKLDAPERVKDVVRMAVERHTDDNGGVKPTIPVATAYYVAGKLMDDTDFAPTQDEISERVDASAASIRKYKVEIGKDVQELT